MTKAHWPLALVVLAFPWHARPHDSAPVTSRPSGGSMVQSGVDWRSLLPAGSRLEQQVSADLDGDGTDEVVVLTSKTDPVLMSMGDVPAEMIRASLELRTQIFGRGPRGFVELDSFRMVGLPQPFRVAPLVGGGKRNFVFASVRHCGASCAGTELSVIGVRAGRVQHLLEGKRLAKGDYTLTSDGALELKEGIFTPEGGNQPVAFRVTRYVIRDGKLVPVARREVPS